MSDPTRPGIAEFRVAVRILSYPAFRDFLPTVTLDWRDYDEAVSLMRSYQPQHYRLLVDSGLPLTSQQALAFGAGLALAAQAQQRLRPHPN